MRHLPLLSTLALLGLTAGVARADVTVTVDVNAGVHPISPLIYGANFASADQSTDARLTVNRWGGNSTSRYNYEIDTSNTGSDYFFENIAGCFNAGQSYCATLPSDPKGTSGFNGFIQAASDRGQVALLTVPTIGWVAKAPGYAHPFACGCPKTTHPNQDSFDPYDANCGNGKSGGKPIDCGDPTQTSVATSPEWAKQWATYLVQTFGPSNGKRVYALDNEPNLWSSTHQDIHPKPTTYDELWQRMRDYADALLDADPTAQIAGPAEWGWPNYFCSAADDINKGCFATSPDRAAHGGQALVPWLLAQAKDHETKTGRRILHYLDLHYYPQGGDNPARTRSLWDPSYTDPSWINDKIRLFPRMHEWVNQSYPGTKLAISEYDFYDHDKAVGAIAYAQVLGLLGRENVDLATAWSMPSPTDPAFAAYRLFGNYDGQGASFGSTSVQASVAGDGVMAFAATAPGRLTVVLTNEGNATSAAVDLGTYAALGPATLFVNSGSAITKSADVSVQSGKVTVSLPAQSIALLAVVGDAGSGAGGSGGSGQAGSGQAGSGTAGSGTAGSAQAGSGTAGSGQAGSGTAGSGTAGSGTAGSAQAGSGTAGGSSSAGGHAGSGVAGSAQAGSGAAGSGAAGGAQAGGKAGQAASGGAGGYGGSGQTSAAGQGATSSAGDAASGDGDDGGGCGCRTTGGRREGGGALVLAAVVLAGRRRRG